MSATVLVVEDELKIRELLRSYLEREGWSVLTTGSGAEALILAAGGGVDLVVLDLGLPDVPGETVAAEIRRSSATPILMLTARAGEDDRIRGLELGADDYVTKPFRFEELLARVRARLREQGTTEQTMLEAGDVVLDLRRRAVTVDGRSVELSSREFALAETLFRHPGQVLSREQLLSMVWGYDFAPESNVVDVYIGYLRRKLGAGRIETVRGMGYRLRAD